MENSRKYIGQTGEKIAAYYLQKQGFTIMGRNIARKTGELDVVAKKKGVLHIVEVKTHSCEEFPSPEVLDSYDPADNLHAYKIQKVARTAEWYVANINWEGDWQVDGVLVWLRRRDMVAKVRYLPQIL
jgi:putative endonuclease